MQCHSPLLPECHKIVSRPLGAPHPREEDIRAGVSISPKCIAEITILGGVEGIGAICAWQNISCEGGCVVGRRVLH